MGQGGIKDCHRVKIYSSNNNISFLQSNTLFFSWKHPFLSTYVAFTNYDRFFKEAHLSFKYLCPLYFPLSLVKSSSE